MLPRPVTSPIQFQNLSKETRLIYELSSIQRLSPFAMLSEIDFAIVQVVFPGFTEEVPLDPVFMLRSYWQCAL